MTAPPERHFSTVWKVSMANVALLTVLYLLSLWVDIPRDIIEWWAIFALGWFGGAELAAGGVKPGFSGTKTSWLFWKIESDTLRVAIGVWMGLIQFFVFPQNWFFYVIATFFFLWLPGHYTDKRAVTFVEGFGRWLKGGD